MIAALLGFLTGFAEPPRLILHTKAGAEVIVEQVPGQVLSVQLFLSARQVPLAVEQRGWRHLLEHLMAHGASGRVDEQLESRGMYLSASTLRETTRFEIRGGVSDLGAALRAVKDLAAPQSFTEDQIRDEVITLQQEAAGAPDRNLSQAFWSCAFPVRRPRGPIDGNAWSEAHAADMVKLDRLLLDPSRVRLVIEGPVELDAASTNGLEALADLKEFAPPEFETKPLESQPETPKLGWAAILNPDDPQKGIARLAAFAGIASRLDSCRLIFTPSSGENLVILTTLDARSFASAKQFLTDAPEEAAINGRGALSAMWNAWMSDPVGRGYLWGTLRAANPQAKPSEYLKPLDDIRDSEILKVVKSIGFLEEGGVLK